MAAVAFTGFPVRSQLGPSRRTHNASISAYFLGILLKKAHIKSVISVNDVPQRFFPIGESFWLGTTLLEEDDLGVGFHPRQAELE